MNAITELSRTMKGLRVYFTCKLTSNPATNSWMLTEDGGLLGERRKSLLFILQQETWASCLYNFRLSSKSLGDDWKWTS